MYGSYSTIKVEIEGYLCTLTLNRPDVRNAINEPMLKEINDFLAKAKDDPNIRAIVLTGAGKSFCAGADLGEWNEKNKKRAESGAAGPAEVGSWVIRA